MYRICVEKATGKLIEMQSGGKVDRLSEQEFNQANENLEITYEYYL